MSSKQRGIKPQRKKAGDRKSEQHPYHPHPKPSSVQSAVGGAHQESVSTATNEHARIDHQPSQQSSSARNEPSSSYLFIYLLLFLIFYCLFVFVFLCCCCCCFLAKVGVLPCGYRAISNSSNDSSVFNVDMCPIVGMSDRFPRLYMSLKTGK